MLRSSSNVITALGLIAVAVVATVVGSLIITRYVATSVKPKYDVTITYAKLVLIAENEVVDNTVYTTYKFEIGVANPGQQKTLQVCIVSAKPSSTTFVPTVLGSCPSITVEPGYKVYSFLLRVNEEFMNGVMCYGSLKTTCPILREWFITVYDGTTPIASVKPQYVVP